MCVAFRYRGVPVRMHWTLYALLAWSMLGGLIVSPPLALVGASGLILMLIHELGHLEMARRRGYRALRIDLYPFIGWCKVDAAESGADACAIAWGGVLAQVPFLLVALAAARFRHLVPEFAAVVLVFGYVNLALIVANLMPIDPLDGHKAWRLLPQLLRAARGG